MRPSTARGRRAGKGRGDAGAVVVGGQAGSPLGLPYGIAPCAVLGDLDFMHAALLLLPSVPADVPDQAHQGVSLVRRLGHRSPASASQVPRPTAGFSFRRLCVCDCSFSLLLVLAIENLFDLILCTDDCCSAMAFCKDW